MHTQLNRSTGGVAALVAFVLAGVLAGGASAGGHPQEVLDLVAAHDALAMNIRVLKDRIVVQSTSAEKTTAFHPDGAPVRAKASTGTSTADTDAEQRVPETLQHRNRAATATDDYGRIKVRLSALEEQAKTERERIMRPNFGVGTRQHDDEGGDIRFGDGQVGARPAASSAPQGQSVDSKQIAEARSNLAALQRELASLEREVNALHR